MTNLLYQCVVGSHLYGTNVAGSDEDRLEVYKESPEQLYGVDATQNLPQKVTETLDTSRHWLRDYAYLLYKSNPNAFEAIWAPPEKIIECHPLFKKYILNNRGLFFGLDNLRKALFGFANAQIKKMEIYSADRGAARKELIDKYGYDLKYANHALRLIFSLQEIVQTHELILPYSPEMCDTLRAIKSGQVSKSNFLEMYNREVKRTEQIVADNRFNLRQTPDREAINQLMVDFYRELGV